MENDSIFTKIIKGEIPSHKIYEDDKTVAFLDIHPVQPGHVLVIPKVQIGKIWDLSPEDYRAVMDTVQKVGRHMRDVLGQQISVRVVGVDMPDHAHVQLIPFTDSSELRYQPDMSAEPDHAALAAMAEKIHL